MRYSTTNSSHSDLWQRILFVLLGAACVVLCYFAGAYWIGPWLHRMRAEAPSASPSASSEPTVVNRFNIPPPTTLPAPGRAPRLAGVRIQEVDPSSLPDTVRVIPAGDGAAADSSAPTEEPQPPSTLEEHPSSSQPPANLWAPAPPATTPSRPADETAPPSGELQLPQPLNDEPASTGSVPTTSSPTDAFYRVRLPNAFGSREEADAALRSVTERGLSAALVADTVAGRKVFRVQLGVYRNRSNAEKLADQARRAGIAAEVAAPSP